MEDDSRVSKLVELIFSRKISSLSEMAYAHSFLPACMLNRKFSQSLLIVFKTKFIYVRNHYLQFVDKCYYRMFRSHEMYLKYLMYACQAENARNLKVFDSFIGICALLMFLSDKTKSETLMDFSNLNLDIFMVFYRDVMHKPFRQAGGLKKFAKYIIKHEYLKEFDNVLTVSVDTSPVNICLKDMLCEFTLDLDVIEKDDTSLSMAREVLLKTSLELPPLKSMHELITKRVLDSQIKMALPKKDEQKTGIEKVLDPKLCRKVLEKGFNPNGEPKINQETAQREKNAEKKTAKAVMSSNSDFETNLTAEQKEDNAQRENLVQGVKRTNTEPETDLIAEQKDDNAQRENFVQGVKTSNSDSETKLRSEQIENKTQKENFVQGVMTSNSDSETNLIAEQKEDNAQRENFVQGVKTSNTDSETDLRSEEKEDSTKKKNFVQSVMTSNSDSETKHRSEQKENYAQKENFVQGVMTFNSDSETNLIAEQKEDNAQRENFVQGAKTSNTDSGTDLRSEQKEDSTKKKNFVQSIMTSNSDSETKLRSEQKKNNAQKENFVQGVMTSNSDSETNLAAEQKEDNVEKEGIVQEVMRYNRSDKAGVLNSDNNILKEVYDIFKHLKMSIQSVSQLLDESDEE